MMLSWDQAAVLALLLALAGVLVRPGRPPVARRRDRGVPRDRHWCSRCSRSGSSRAGSPCSRLDDAKGHALWLWHVERDAALPERDHAPAGVPAAPGDHQGVQRLLRDDALSRAHHLPDLAVGPAPRALPAGAQRRRDGHGRVPAHPADPGRAATRCSPISASSTPRSATASRCTASAGAVSPTSSRRCRRCTSVGRCSSRAYVIKISPSPWRWLVLVHTTLTILIVTVTANHWWLDGVVAVMLLGSSMVVERWSRIASPASRRANVLSPVLVASSRLERRTNERAPRGAHLRGGRGREIARMAEVVRGVDPGNAGTDVSRVVGRGARPSRRHGAPVGDADGPRPRHRAARTPARSISGFPNPTTRRVRRLARRGAGPLVRDVTRPPIPSTRCGRGAPISTRGSGPGGCCTRRPCTGSTPRSRSARNRACRPGDRGRRHRGAARKSADTRRTSVPASPSCAGAASRSHAQHRRRRFLAHPSRSRTGSAGSEAVVDATVGVPARTDALLLVLYGRADADRRRGSRSSATSRCLPRGSSPPLSRLPAMTGRLDGKVAVVTGAGRRAGRGDEPALRRGRRGRGVPGPRRSRRAAHRLRDRRSSAARRHRRGRATCPTAPRSTRCSTRPQPTTAS